MHRPLRGSPWLLNCFKPYLYATLRALERAFVALIGASTHYHAYQKYTNVPDMQHWFLLYGVCIRGVPLYLSLATKPKCEDFVTLHGVSRSLAPRRPSLLLFGLQSQNYTEEE